MTCISTDERTYSKYSGIKEFVSIFHRVRFAFGNTQTIILSTDLDVLLLHNSDSLVTIPLDKEKCLCV